jgi:hypothetical protein
VPGFIEVLGNVLVWCPARCKEEVQYSSLRMLFSEADSGDVTCIVPLRRRYCPCLAIAFYSWLADLDRYLSFLYNCRFSTATDERWHSLHDVFGGPDLVRYN